MYNASGLSLRFQVGRESNQLEISFGSIFLLFSYESSWGATFLVAKGNPWPLPLNDSPDSFLVEKKNWEITTTKEI